MGAVGTEVMQPPKVGLQVPTGQLDLQQLGQVAEDKGVQGGRAEAEGEECEGGGDFGGWGEMESEEEMALGGGSGPQGPLG